MHRKSRLRALAGAAFLTLTALASPVRATQPSTPITVELAMPTLPSLNQSVPVSVTVTSLQDAPDTRVELVLSPGITALTSGWTVNLIANQPVTFTSSVIAQTAGNGKIGRAHV